VACEPLSEGSLVRPGDTVLSVFPEFLGPPARGTADPDPDALARWDQAVARANAGAAFVPIGELTRQVGAWAWEFTLRGTRVKITRVAVTDAAVVTVSPAPWDPMDAPVGYFVESATRSADGRKLAVSFTGARNTAQQPCGADYTARTVESDAAVVVIIVEHEYDGPNRPAGCSQPGFPRTATVELDRPLGGRVVLEVQGGMPVPVTAG